MTKLKQSYDFEHCDDEPIHIPGSIQNHGYLMAIDVDSGRFMIVSENLSSLLANDKIVADKSFYDLIDDESTPVETVKQTFHRAKKENVRLPVEITFKSKGLVDHEHVSFHAVVYESNRLFVLEIEPATEFQTKIAARQYSKIYAMKTVPSFASMESVREMANAIADTVRLLTGFERVIIYRFNSDQSGQVIAESKVDDMQTYQDLFCPASDIPTQARELYLKNWVRLVSNVEAEQIALLTTGNYNSEEPFDLTNSLLRSMSPIHMQYVRNQGLKASMSVSLVSRGKLWGLVSCHHRKEYYLPQDIRLEVESLSQLFSWQLYAKEEEIAQSKRQAADIAIAEMINKISAEKDIGEIFQENATETLQLMNACGFVFSYGERSVHLGEIPPNDELNDILAKVMERSKQDSDPVRITNLSEFLDKEKLGSKVAGAVVVPILKENNFYTAWFREENIRERRWAGNPDEKTALVTHKERRLEPRTNFEVHVERISNECKAWNDDDLRVADSFNRLFLQHALRSQVFLRKNMDLLQEQDKSRNDFLATLAHELRNPLSPIVTAVELLKDPANSDIWQDASNMMERQIKQLVTLIDDLMDVSRITQGKIAIAMTKVDLRQVIDDAIETAKRHLTAKKQNLKIDIPEGEIKLTGDATRLSQVFANVLNNAVKYSGMEADITIEVEVTKNFVTVHVIDTGIGIDPSYLPAIFDMFSQADEFSTNTKGGLGIGMTLAQKLVKLHSGTIEAFSDGLGKGSRFSVRLPVSPLVQIKDGNQSNEQAKSSGEQSDEKQKGLGVLLVDDNQDSLEMLQLLVGRGGNSVQIAATGEQAVKLFKEHQPSLVLLDIGLPDMDGFEVCKQIRNFEAEHFGKGVC